MSAYEALKLSNQLCFPLYTAARKITAHYTPLLKPLGLTYTQYIVLMCLWERDGMTVGELGERLYLDSGTLTPLLKKLEGAGIITRSRNTHDERVVTASLTDKGRQLRERCKDIPTAVGSDVPLDEQESLQLYETLYKIIGAL